MDTLARYHKACAALAADADMADKLTDPSYAADRRPQADALRAEMHAEALREYREAAAALHAEYA